jgi:hypothetical protein
MYFHLDRVFRRHPYLGLDGWFQSQEDVGIPRLLALNPPFAMNASLNGGDNATASLENPLPNLQRSSFPNFVATVLPGPPFTGSSFLRTPDIIDPDFKESTLD